MPGHPRLAGSIKSWMPGTSPGMTRMLAKPSLTAALLGQASGGQAQIWALADTACAAIIVGQKQPRTTRATEGNACHVRKTENPRRPGQVPGTCALQIAGARTVRSRRIRQRP